MESSWARDWTCILCVGRQILNHWTTTEVQGQWFFHRSWFFLNWRMIALWCHVGFYRAYLHVKLLQSCPTLCDPMDYSLQGSSVHGIFQLRILKWVAMPSSRGSSQLRDWTCISSLLNWQAGSLPLHYLGSPGPGVFKVWFLDCSISITWEFVRNVSSCDFPRCNEWQALREGPAICIFIRLPLDLIHTSLKTVAVSTFQTEEMGRNIAKPE